jgi:hypothetical protein
MCQASIYGLYDTYDYLVIYMWYILPMKVQKYEMKQEEVPLLSYFYPHLPKHLQATYEIRYVIEQAMMDIIL